MRKHYVMDGTTIKLLMEAQGLNQKTLSEKAGLSGTLVYFSLNKRPVTDYTVSKLALFFDVDPKSLVLEVVNDGKEIHKPKGRVRTQ